MDGVDRQVFVDGTGLWFCSVCVAAGTKGLPGSGKHPSGGLSSILQVSVAPPGLDQILRPIPGVPFGHPRLLTVAPPGG
jgi:hypothetical protein